MYPKMKYAKTEQESILHGADLQKWNDDVANMEGWTAAQKIDRLGDLLKAAHELLVQVQYMEPGDELPNHPQMINDEVVEPDELMIDIYSALKAVGKTKWSD